MKTELLAPAKNKEVAFAAIDCGADAIYIGATDFGARQNATNSLDDIREIVQYAHKYWVKVFVTVNTVIKDNELSQAVKLVKELDKIGVDAVLIQDMGLLKSIMDSDIKIPIHASTQCDNRDIEKVTFLNSIGMNRVVLARELSLETIRKIHDENPMLELESFIHGALCVSYSGQCYLSYYIGGRSANRGECAQPCRKKYKVQDDSGNFYKYNYPLCLKDLNASSHIKQMIDAGIYSFKIEGRLKDIGYVKNIVSYYRQELDKYSEKSSSGRGIYPYQPDPEKSFNRGFTDYFLDKRGDCFNGVSPASRGKYAGNVLFVKNDCIVVDSKLSISPHDGLCYEKKGELVGFLVNKIEKKNENQIIIYPNHPIKISIGDKLYRNYDIEFENLLKKKVKRQIAVNVCIENGELVIADEDKVSVLYKFKDGETAQNQDRMNKTFIKQFSKTGESDFYIKEICINSPIPFMPVGMINQLRRELFAELTEKRINIYKRESARDLKYSAYYKKELDYRANITNQAAKTFYENCGCKIKEFGIEIKTPKRQIELMRTKHCIKYALNMCKSPKKLFLIDEKGVKYPLKFDCKNCEMILLSPNK